MKFIIIIVLISLIFVYKKVSFSNSKSFFENSFVYEPNIGFIFGERYLKYCHDNKQLCVFLPHQSRIADQTWLKGIQLAGQMNARTGLLNNLEYLTSLDPYWETPYILGQFLLPIPKGEISNPIKEKQAQQSRIDTVKFGEKGIKYMCDSGLIQKYSSVDEKTLITLFDKKGDISMPCVNYGLPSSLGFNYYYYLQNYNKSSLYYKIAALSPGAPISTLSMPAVILGRLGQHLKSASLRYDKYKFTLNREVTKEKNTIYLKKALTELLLDIITKADQSPENTSCVKDIDCLYNSGLIKKQIDDLNDACNQTQNDSVIQMQCDLEGYGLENGFINEKLIYPVEPNAYVFGRREDIEDRWIVPVE